MAQRKSLLPPRGRNTCMRTHAATSHVFEGKYQRQRYQIACAKKVCTYILQSKLVQMSNTGSVYSIKTRNQNSQVCQAQSCLDFSNTIHASRRQVHRKQQCRRYTNKVCMGVRVSECSILETRKRRCACRATVDKRNDSEYAWYKQIVGERPEQTYNEGPYYYVQNKKNEDGEDMDELDIAPSNRPDGSVVRPSTWSSQSIQDSDEGLSSFDEEWNMMWTESKEIAFSKTKYTIDIDCMVQARVDICYKIMSERERYYFFMPFIHSIRVVDNAVPELARVEMYYRYQFYPTFQLIFGLLTVEKRENEFISYETDDIPNEKAATRHGVFPMKV